MSDQTNVEELKVTGVAEVGTDLPATGTEANPATPAAPAPLDGPLTGHCYDGIEEYDNPLPGWWSWLFVLTILFSAAYFFVNEATGGMFSAVTAYDKDVSEANERQFSSRVFNPDAKTLVELSHDQSMLKIGEGIFQTNCVACHGRNAEGLVGPNLTDDYYLNVVKIEDFVDVITKGRKNGSMPAWSNKLSPNQIIVVASYVASLRGKNLPGKPPEGKIPPPWSAK